MTDMRAFADVLKQHQVFQDFDHPEWEAQRAEATASVLKDAQKCATSVPPPHQQSQCQQTPTAPPKMPMTDDEFLEAEREKLIESIHVDEEEEDIDQRTRDYEAMAKADEEEMLKNAEKERMRILGRK